MPIEMILREVLDTVNHGFKGTPGRATHPHVVFPCWSGRLLKLGRALDSLNQHLALVPLLRIQIKPQRDEVGLGFFSVRVESYVSAYLFPRVLTCRQKNTEKRQG